MPFTCNCPGCAAPFSLADELRGKQVRCKSCGDVFRAEGATETPATVWPVDAPDPAGGEEVRLNVPPPALPASPARPSLPRRGPMQPWGDERQLAWILAAAASLALVVTVTIVAAVLFFSRSDSPGPVAFPDDRPLEVIHERPADVWEKRPFPEPKPQLPPPPQGVVAEAFLPDNAGAVLALGYSSDGKSLALGTTSEQALWYDLVESRWVARWQPQGQNIGRELSGCAISPKADKVAFIKHGGLLYFIDRANPDERVLLATEGPAGIAQWKAAFSPDGGFICTTHGDRLGRNWDLTGRRLERELPGHKEQVGSCAYSPDGALLACADTNIILWDAKTFARVGSIKGPGQFFLSAMAFSPDGKTLAGIHDRTVYVWAIESGKEGEKSAGEPRQLLHVERPRLIAFTSSGMLLTVAAEDFIRVWDHQAREVRHELKLTGFGSPSAIALRPADGQLAVACGNRIFFFNAQALKRE